MNLEKEKLAIVSVVIGDKFLKSFNKTFRPSLESFAKKTNIELVIVDKYIRESEKHPSWQKLLMFDHEKLLNKQRLLFLDGDIYVTRHAKNPFEVFGDEVWSMAQNNPYNLPSLVKTDPDLYETCPKENRPEWALNTGVFIITPEYKSLMEQVYRDYPEQPCRENGPLSYHLINDNRGKILPAEFNTIVVCYREAFGQGLSVILKMYKESSFIHFAGGKCKFAYYIVKYIDENPNSLVTKILYVLGNKIFDRITSKLIWFSDKLIAIYNYHIKRRFLKLLK